MPSFCTKAAAVGLASPGPAGYKYSDVDLSAVCRKLCPHA